MADDDISRLETFVSGEPIYKSEVDAELNQLVNSMNGKMSRSGLNTVSGNNTFSGTSTFSGAVTLSSTVSVTGTFKAALVSDPGSPAEGMLWTNTTAHLLKWYNGSTTKIIATTADILTAVPDVSGQSGKYLTNNGSVTSWGAAPAFTAKNQSSNITITAGGSWSFTHGLGVAPYEVQLWLVNLSAELGYSVGDMEKVSSDNAHGTGDLGAAVCIPTGNTTSITGRFGADNPTFVIGHKTTGVNTFITNAKWALIVRAWA